MESVEEVYAAFTQAVLQIAQVHKNPSEFIASLQQTFEIPATAKADFLAGVAEVLSESGYFALALALWTSALEDYLEKGNDKTAETACLSNIGVAYIKLGDPSTALGYCENALGLYRETRDISGESGCYTNIGNCYRMLGKFRKAIQNHEKSLKIKKKIGDKNGESSCYLNLGNAWMEMGRIDKALEYYQKSLLIAKQLKIKFVEAYCHASIGIVYRRMRRPEKTILELEEAIGLSKEIGDRATEALCYQTLGNAYADLGVFTNTVRYYEKSLEICIETGNSQAQSQCYVGLGEAYYRLGNAERAIEYCDSALKISAKIKDKATESQCYLRLGNTYALLGHYIKAIEFHHKCFNLIDKNLERGQKSDCYESLAGDHFGMGDFRQAIKLYRTALRLRTQSGDIVGQAKCCTGLAATFTMLGDSNEAVAYHTRALSIVRDANTEDEKSACHMNLGLTYLDLGYPRQAIECYEKALEVCKQTKNKDTELAGYVNLGSAYHILGDHAKATEYLLHSMEMSVATGNKHAESNTLMSLGIIYEAIGNYKDAIQCHEKALQIAEKMGDKYAMASCYGNLGNAYFGLAAFTQAIEYQNKFLAIVTEIGNQGGQSRANTNLGNAYLRLGKPAKSMEYHRKALALAKTIGDMLSESRSYLNIANVYFLLGNIVKAIEYNNKAMMMSKRTGNINLERSANYNLGLIFHRGKADLNLAFDYYKQAIILSEMVSGRILEEQQKIGFYAELSDTYQAIISISVKLGRIHEAFSYVEMSKSRALIDLLAATKIKPRIELTGELELLLRSEETLLGKLQKIQRYRPGQGKLSTEDPKEIEVILQELNEIYSKLQAIDPDYVSVRRGTPLSALEALDMLSSQKKGMTLLEYFVCKDATFVFILSSRQKTIYVKTIPVSEKELVRDVGRCRAEISRCTGQWVCGDGYRALSQHLVEPVAEHLTGTDLLYIVPHGPIHYIPVHALELKGDPMIVHHPVVYSPSTSLIRLCQKKGSGKTQSCASFGIVFEEEARSVAHLFGTEPYNGPKATKEMVNEICLDKDVIHFSCHGHFKEGDPLSSGLQLFNGTLTVREIFNMEFDPELVTLSACETGLSERSRGDELIGLTRAFMYAGSPSIVTSLWSVDAEATQEFMVQFYRQLIDGSTDKATALQEAQRRMMEKQHWSHPYFWAPFILVGDWQ